MKRLGIDIGSLYIGYALLEDKAIIASGYQEHNGKIALCLDNLCSQFQAGSFDSAGITGNFHSTENSILNNTLLDNTLCAIEGAQLLLPGVRNVLSIGGQSFMLICFHDDGKYKEHTVNPPCASGTGAFIEQQAERLQISVQELSRLADLYNGKVPAIATRCAVFAKSDIIHAMQEGYSLDAVCAGICEGIARNVLDSLVKGRALTDPVGLIGGVSLNRKLARSIAGLLKLKIRIPEAAPVAGAVGAALLGRDLKLSADLFGKRTTKPLHTRKRLSLALSVYPDFNKEHYFQDQDVEVFTNKEAGAAASALYLGLDIGSTSTKAILIDENNRVAGGFYTATRGNPVAAVQNLLASIKRNLQSGLRITAACTTGSGRKMIKKLFQADSEINEITAHARAAVLLHPGVDTIIEIGGQDSKFTLVKNGDVYFSSMNYVCAAGTGSFIEEQARRLGVTLDEFAELALKEQAPYTSDRCTVYMERDLGVLLGEGWPREALAASVLYSVRDNYLSKVVNKSPIGRYVVFQGATARNRALVAAFENFLQQPVHVSPYCHLTGALGAALTAREEGITQSAFLFEAACFRTREEICLLCANHCLLTVTDRQEEPAAWGMKCGREYTARSRKQDERIPAPVLRSRDTFRNLFAGYTAGKSGNTTIALPEALYNRTYTPLWFAFLSRLGLKPIVVNPDAGTLAAGKTLVNSDFCAPMIMAHGFMLKLMAAEVNYIFFPAIINDGEETGTGEILFRKKTNDSYYCYYSQNLPSIISKLTAIDVNSKLISPCLSLKNQEPGQVAALLYAALADKLPGLSREETAAAYHAALAGFRASREKLIIKQPVCGNKELQVVILGRPYVMFDPVINLKLPAKLEELGARLFWQEELDLENFTPLYANQYLERMHWFYGRQILLAAEYAARTPALFAVYLSCFRCSPDSFLLSYIKDIMTHYNKPFLVLQLDEHASDVGYTTRIEAGVRSFRQYMKTGGSTPAGKTEKTTAQADKLQAGNTVLVPYINRLMSSFWAAAFNGAGFNTIVLENSRQALNTGYRYANGGECMPAVAIAGGVLEAVGRHNLDPAGLFFYMPSLCLACNFPQFTVLCRMIFQAAGLKGIRIGYINSMEPGDALPGNLAMRIFETSVLASLIYKMYYAVKPYAADPAAVDAVLQQAETSVCGALSSGGDLREQFQAVCSLFRSVKPAGVQAKKPRIAILGDLYLKYNEMVNQNVAGLIMELGGTVIIPSFTELAFHFYDTDVRLYGDSPRHMKLLKMFESRYEKQAGDLTGDQQEPDWNLCYELISHYGIKHYIPGETSLNVGRALYYAAHKKADAIVHTNPIFCCPGVVTASIYRKIQADYGIPVIDIFYDGTGDPNRILVPHIHYLKQIIGGK